MKPFLIGFITFLAILLSSTHSFAVQMDNKIGYAYGALGMNIGPNSFRLGRNAWEAGLINSQALGVARVFRTGSVGIAGIGLSYGRAPGLFSFVGLEAKLLLNWIAFRSEINGFVDVVGNSHGEFLVGLLVHL